MSPCTSYLTFQFIGSTCNNSSRMQCKLSHLTRFPSDRLLWQGASERNTNHLSCIHGTFHRHRLLNSCTSIYQRICRGDSRMTAYWFVMHSLVHCIMGRHPPMEIHTIESCLYENTQKMRTHLSGTYLTLIRDNIDISLMKKMRYLEHMVIILSLFSGSSQTSYPKIIIHLHQS